MKKTTIKNPNGIGSIEPRGKKGIYVARWMVDGKTFKKSTGTADKTEALRLLKEWTAPFLLESDVATVQALAAQARVKANLSKSVPLADVYEAWKNRHKGQAWAQGTEERYSQIVRQLVEWMTANHPKVKDLAGVTPEIASEYLSKKITPNHSPRYANDVVTALRNAWDIVQGTGDGIVNPWDGKTKRDDDSAEKQPFTADELKTIIEKAPSEEWRTLILIAAYTGQRVSDCCNFKWSDINFEKDCFNPFKQKKTGNVVRNLPLHPELRAQLEKTPKAERTGFVVPHFEERYRVNSSKISGGFSNYLQRIGLHKTEKRPGEKRVRSLTSFHSLRHTFISNAIAAGMTLDQVSLISGHLSRKNAERYSHSNADINTAVVMAQPSLTGTGATAATNKMTQLDRLVADWSPEDIKAAIKALQKKID